MNYLSHQYVARQIRPDAAAPAQFFAGNLLPDLVAIAGDGRMRGIAPAATGALADGVRQHIETDNAFHSAAAFKALVADAGGRIAGAAWRIVPHRRFFIAHVLVELALDAYLLHTEPCIADDLYATLRVAVAEGLVARAESLAERALPNLAPMLERFLATEYLRDYGTDAGLARAVRRVCARANLPNFADPADEETLAGVFAEFAAVLAPRAEELLRSGLAQTEQTAGLEQTARVVQ